MSLTKVTFSMIQGAKVNVLDFGASTSVSPVTNVAAMQAAIDSLPASGGTVYFPGGNYQKNAALTITKSNVYLVGERNSVLSDTTSGYNSIEFSASLTNVGVHNLSFNGVTDTTHASAGYAVIINSDATKVRITDCSFAGYTGGIGALVNVSDLEITGCRFADMTYIPADGVGGYGILGEACNGVRVLNNYFAETVQRHHVYVSRDQLTKTALSTNWTISGNNFYSKSNTTYITGFEYACKIMAAQDVTISGNTFSGGMGHVWINSLDVSYSSPYSSRIIVTGNTFSNIMKGDSTQSACVGSTASTIYNIIIANNVMNSCDTGAHISLTLGTSIKVSGNIISSPVSGDGIAATNPIQQLSVSDNYIEVLTGYRGINIGSTTSGGSLGATIKDNRIIGAADFGVFMRDAVDALIEDNQIESASTSIMVFDGNFAGTIRGNLLKSSAIGINLPVAFTAFAWVYGNNFNTCTQNIKNEGSGWIGEPYGNLTANTGTQRKLVFNVLNAAPTTGTWTAGDVCMSNAPASAEFIGYVCTVGGTSGTWKSFGLIS